MSGGGMTPSPAMYQSLRNLLKRRDGAVVSAAARVVASSADETSLTALEPLLDHDEASVRVLVAQLLSRVRPERAMTLIVERTKKEKDVAVLAALFRRLGDCLDHRAVPALLAAMRYPNGEVRGSAKEALAQIREYYDHKERFSHWLGEFDLREESAAEALLDQARKENDKKLRLAAIHSLGTLAVPETLPILIRMMQESDPDIAQAAEKAVAHINKGVLQEND